MNKLLRWIFLAIGIAFGLFALLLTWSLPYQGISLLSSKIFYASIFCALLFVVAAFALGREWKFRIFLLLFTLALLEAALQAAAWTGVLPGVNTKLKAPYARVYWTGEGRGNSIRNSLGWYYPEFDLKASRRIVAIGDSFVEAVEVNRTKNHAYLLQQRLKQNSPDWSVIALGTHGTAPAQHLEVLEYAQKHFKPQEAIIYLYLGNDITESSPRLNTTASYIYYDLDDHNHLVLTPGSAEYRLRFDRDLELSHQPFWYWLPTLLESHCMTLQSALSVRGTFLQQRQQAARTAATGAAKDPVDRALQEMGINPAPFALNPGPEATQAMKVLEAELERLKAICDTNGIRLRLVTIPLFPPAFYATQKGSDWTLKIGNYDYLAPDRELAAFAREKNIQLLSLADQLRAKKLAVEQIRSLYLSQGSGHFTEAGHRFCADAVYLAFYRTNR
jgi:hypothetical protein